MRTDRCEWLGEEGRRVKLASAARVRRPHSVTKVHKDSTLLFLLTSISSKLSEMVDVIKLIRAVKCRDPLWDRKHAFYHDRTVTMGLWEEVAALLGVDSDSARAKWKGLRDTFRGELKKVNKARIKGQALGVNSTNWEYFHEMLFVKDQIYSNKRSLESMLKTYMRDSPSNCNLDLSNICKTEVLEMDLSNICKTEVVEMDMSTVCKTEVIEDPQDFEPNMTANINEDVRKSSDSEMETLQEKRLKAEKEASEADDDYNFLMSLLPQLRSLPTTRNLFIRLKMQELLYNEIISLQINGNSS